MTTALDLIIQSLKAAGVVGVGQTPLAEDTNDAFHNLQQMLAQWQRRRWLIPSLMDIYNIGNNKVSNQIGLGQYYDTPRPDKLQAAYVRLLNNSSVDFNDDFNNDFNIAGATSAAPASTTNIIQGDFSPTDFVSPDFYTGATITSISSSPLAIPVDYPLQIIDSYERYSQIAIKYLNSFPYCVFYDAAYPYGNVFVWPIPSEAYEIHLILKSALQVPTLVSDDLVIAPEYEEAIWTNLTVRLVINYQLSASKEIIALAKSSLNTIRNSNAQVPVLNNTIGPMGGLYNIYSDRIY